MSRPRAADTLLPYGAYALFPIRTTYRLNRFRSYLISQVPAAAAIMVAATNPAESAWQQGKHRPSHQRCALPVTASCLRGNHSAHAS
ncbi:MAG: hypothetical protein KJ063_11785 [Anaerolineae bacterium]|nr:hypothetical protein [Anaerolineae bacterium]